MLLQIDFGTPLYDEAVRLRDRVLRQPLGRSIADDELEKEATQIHLVKLFDGHVVATVSLLPEKEAVKLRQMAVAPEVRGRGFGRQLLAYAVDFAGRVGYSRLYCHARLEAKEFYAKAGWKAIGEEFEEVGIPHIEMEYVGPAVSADAD